MMEKYISLRITEQLEKKRSILVPRVNLNLYLSTGAPGHIFKTLISINYKNKVYKSIFIAID